MEQNTTPAATVTPPATPEPAPAQRPKRRRTVLLAGTTALVVAALVLARFTSAPPEDAAEDEQLARSDMPIAAAGIVEPVVADPPMAHAVKARPATAAKVTPAGNRVVASSKATAALTPIAAHAIGNVPDRIDAAATNERAASVSTESVGPAPVTLTGCLEISVDRDEFRLTDTDGADAPRSRSWRTGFLKKRSTPVALVEPTDPHSLQTQVGKRIAATGQLTDRELRVSSVRVVGPSCE